MDGKVMGYLEAKANRYGEIAGWDYSLPAYDDETWVSFRLSSPAGEDFSFEVEAPDIDTLIDNVRDYYNDFDPDAHAASWYGQHSGEPQSLRDLIDDAEAIQSYLEELSDALRR